MSTYLDFESTRNGKFIPDSKQGFRDFLLSRNLLPQNGPQTFTSGNYNVNNLNDFSVIDSGDVTPNKNLDGLNNKTPIQVIQSSNTYKPLEYVVQEEFNVLPRRSNLSLYPYFPTTTEHSLISILTTDNFENESELFKFSAKYIKKDENGPLQSRIKQNLYTATSGKVRLLDALDGNISTISNIVTGKEPLIELNNHITVSDSFIGQSIDFTQTVAGVTLPFTEIPGNYLTNPKNPIQNKVNQILDTVGRTLGLNNLSLVIRPSDLFLEYMGDGQKKILFENLSYSKYNPNYSRFNNNLFSSLTIKPQYIGDEESTDVKFSISDNNGRQVRSPYYLSLLFDSVQAEVFKRDKNISEGGSIAGNLTWYTTKSRNKIGSGNVEYTSESSQYTKTLSTNYTFNDNSILSVTQDILNTLPSDSTFRSHVANAIDQTSRLFKDGDVSISKGSAIKYIDKFTNNESGVEYCRVWTKDRSYMNYSDTMKRTGLNRNYESSVMSTPWNLNIAPISNGNKGFENSTNMEKHGDGFRAKKYMFSIENLAWKTSNKPDFRYEDLPYCERGPNGGRIMWFPPYGIDINENNSAKWEDTNFLGRPEPIFTYQNTSRSINLKFKIIVDHPSILNLLVREHFKNMNDEESTNYINAFFAGCENLDFYDLIKRYSTLDSTDIDAIISYLNDGKDENTIKQLRVRVEPEGQLIPPKTETTDTKTVTIDKSLYFFNDVPTIVTDDKYSEQNYDKYFESYNNNKDTYITNLINAINDVGNKWVNDKKNNDGTYYNGDYFLLSSQKHSEKPINTFDTIKNKVIETINSGFTEAYKEFKELNSELEKIKGFLNEKKIKTIKIGVVASASAVASAEYNNKLSYRRANSVIKYVISKLHFDSNPSKDIIEKLTKWILPNNKYVSGIQPKINPIKFTDLGYKYDGSINFEYIFPIGESLGSGTENIVINEDTNISDYKNIKCGNETEPKNTKLKIYGPNAFFCRQTTTKIEYKFTEIVPGDDGKLPTKKVTIVETETEPKSKPTIDVLKKIVMKVLSECYYFQKLEESSPIQFSSLKEKLKYFHPAFHSMTPEGLNSRLTFLHQCIRPGDTIPIKGIADTTDINTRNTSFGPPPIVIFRFGDFYHTKAIIRDYNITFDQNIWDLNPEGIGVQPMIADVVLNLSVFGGQGMVGPVNELQNALSSNFYANTEVYDYRSTSTEDRSKFNKEILESIRKYNKIDLSQKYSDLPKVSNIVDKKYIGDMSTTNLSYTNLVSDIFKYNNEYYTSLKNETKSLIKKYGRSLASIYLSDKYRTINQYDVQTGSSTKTIKLLGLYKKGVDIYTLTEGIKKELENKINNSDISTLYGFNMDNSVKKYSNEVIKKFLKENILPKISGSDNDMTMDNKIKSIENTRDNLILTIDKLNFLVEVQRDGYISNLQTNTFSGTSLTDFTGFEFYKNYDNVINFIQNHHDDFQQNLDISVDYENLTLNDNEFIDLITTFITNDDIKNLLELYSKKDGKIFKKSVLNDIEFKIRNIFNKLENLTNKVLSSFDVWADLVFPLTSPNFNNRKIEFIMSTPYEFTDNEKIMLMKVNTKKLNKSESSLLTKLNFYRP